MSVISRLVVRLSFAVLALTIHWPSAWQLLAPTDWFIKGCIMCYHVYVIMRVKVPWPSFVRVAHCVLLAGFYLPLYYVYSLHVLNRDVNMIQIKIQTTGMKVI